MNQLMRFIALASAALLLSGCTGPTPRQASKGFSFADVSRIAAEAAAKPYVSPEKPMPPGAEKYTYDDFRTLLCTLAKAPWDEKKHPFSLRYIPRGWLFKVPVEINIIRPDGHVEPVPFQPDFFHFEIKGWPKAPENLGFAGLRLNYHTYSKDGDGWPEVLTFLGASYFRALSWDQVYGASARSLAIDTGTDHEEFPVITRFWIHEPYSGPATDVTSLYMHNTVEIDAIMESPSVVAAFSYVVFPGEDTTVNVTAKIYARKDIAKLGIAPITSMFLYGERSDRRFPNDFRPEVHDSDGLLIHDGANSIWTWRPLNNPQQLRTIDHPVKQMRGFGLMQRDRNFDHYLDLEASYHKRPSVWIEPLGQWGAGSVELFELATELEYNDNSNAYWVPKQPLHAGQSLELHYIVHWLSTEPADNAVGKVISTHRLTLKESKDGREGKETGRMRYIIEFQGPALAKLRYDLQKPETLPQLWINPKGGKGKILGARAQPNPYTGGWRAVFEFDPEGATTVELEAGLARGGVNLTETWSERWDR